jgi:hypothetical protein
MFPVVFEFDSCMIVGVPVVEGSHTFARCQCDTLRPEAREHTADKV